MENQARSTMTPPATDTEYPEYEYENLTTGPTTAPPVCSALCFFLAAVCVIIYILSVAENGLVIWTAGFKVKRSVNTTWYLALSVSDFIFLLFLPLDLISVDGNEWNFMRKISSFIMSFNMFSSIFLLVIISVDRCVVMMFPVWVQNQRTVRKASGITVLAWILSAVLSTPSFCFQDVLPDEQTAKVVYEFIFGFMIPFLIIIICYVVIIGKLRTSNHTLRFKKPFKIMTGLIASFLICWLPFHIFAFIKLNYKEDEDLLQMEEVFGVVLACVESFLTPMICVLMRKDFQKHVKSCVKCKI
ncbi:chemokine-like receptor 1 [Astyanax mexicanus]|uniref:Chemokine-like receptor 1 n=1 Tax=Astyanax mexicanus TaxID=7994 RepID=A0A8T2KU71_ASTMX|nr:chemokine-like receptor 1 [Astyanax mexicanus]